MDVPAKAVSRNSPETTALFKRLMSKNGMKKKGLITVSRKLIELIYVLCKNETTHDFDYYRKKIKK
jgi:transposase